MSWEEEKGAILIITLWILAILTILSVGVAGRMGLELKLTSFYRDNMKALYLAKAGINRVIAEKEKDETLIADMLNESWANNKELFDDYKISETEDSTYTIKYTYKENLEDKGTELYGMSDEASRININKIVRDDGNTVDSGIKAQLLWLLINVCGLTEDEALYKANALIDWIDEKPAPQEIGSDTEDYADIYPGFEPKKRLESIEELFLIKGFDSTILYGDAEQEKHSIIDYITIYTGEPKVNINTAPKEVLQALGFNGQFEGLADGIIAYRKNGGDTGGPENQSINLNDLKIQLSNPIFGKDLTVEEVNQINSASPYLETKSKTFRIYARGKVNKVEKKVNCVVILESDKNTFKYWNEQ